MHNKPSKLEEIPKITVEYPDQSPTPRFMVQDYWVDLLGGLLPGTLISIVGFVSIVPAVVLLLDSMSMDYQASFFSLVRDGLVAAQSTPSMIWFGAGTILFSLFYVLGHMFYRQDPKQPNQESFEHVMQEIINKPRNKSKKQSELDELLESELACKTKDECEFPFPYFHKYLENRGLKHLIPFVTWANETDYRTKNYVNILKVRLRFYFPIRCGTIIRNEAHVRLASSTWYAGEAMFNFSKIAIAMVVASIVIYFITEGYAKSDAYDILAQHIGVLMLAMFIWWMGHYVREKVERFLHYQRMREVVHVMETAFTAFQEYPDLMCPPFCPKQEKEPKDVA
jgi:hypothetical protein